MNTKKIDLALDLKRAPSDSGEFEGYASVFGVLDRNGDVVERNAFRKSLDRHLSEGSWPLLLAFHDMTNEVGEITALREDDRGLYISGRLWIDGDAPDRDAQKIYRSMKKSRGAMGMSIGFRMVESDYDRSTGVRTLTEIDLIEVSLLPNAAAANQAAIVTGVKSGLPLKDYEAMLRDAGISHRTATTAVSVLKGYLARDAHDGSTEDATRDEAAQDALMNLAKEIEKIRQSIKI